MHPVYTFPPYFPNNHSNIFPSTTRSSKWSLPFRCSDQNVVCFSSFPCVLHALAMSFWFHTLIIMSYMTGQKNEFVHCLQWPHLIHMKCGYEVPGTILLQAYLYTYILLRGVTFKVLPLSSYALNPIMLTLLNSCCGIASLLLSLFLYVFSILKSSSL